ncbi:MAG: sulfatase-like hydrolase/transferase, partial [Salegentibacter sp.]
PYPEKWNKWNQKIGGAEKAHKIYVDSLVGTTLKDTAQAFIKKHKGEPFFLYYATTNIHHPFTPAKRFLGSSDAGRYGDFIEELDWIVGEIMKTLDEEGIADNTLLILTSDNGGMLNMGGQDAYAMDHKLNGDLLGFKFDAWEGGHRIPFIARWPGHIEPETVSDQLISNVDMLATFAAIFDRDLKDGEGVDSYNVLPALTGNPEEPIRKSLLIAADNLDNLALRMGKWMYISGQGGGGFSAPYRGMHDYGGPPATVFTHQQNSDIENGKLKENAPPAQLYNLETDLSEKHNLYSEYPEIVKRMQQKLEEIRNSKISRPE